MRYLLFFRDGREARQLPTPVRTMSNYDRRNEGRQGSGDTTLLPRVVYGSCNCGWPRIAERLRPALAKARSKPHSDPFSDSFRREILGNRHSYTRIPIRYGAYRTVSASATSSRALAGDLRPPTPWRRQTYHQGIDGGLSPRRRQSPRVVKSPGGGLHPLPHVGELSHQRSRRRS